MISVVRLAGRARRLLAGGWGWLRADRRRRLLVGAALGAVPAVLSVIAVLAVEDRAAGGGESAPAAGVEQLATVAVVGPAPDVSRSAGAVPIVGAGGTPKATTAPPPPPRIHPFAQQPGRTPHAVLPSPTAPLTVEEGNDGCDHGYGDRNVCVPWRFPPGVTDYCGWLAAHGYPPLKVRNDRDRHGLDTNRDGIACGPGDRGA